MGTDDKIRHKAEEAAGAAKRRAGEVTDDEDLESEGMAEQAKAKGKQAIDDLTDSAETAEEKARRSMGR